MDDQDARAASKHLDTQEQRRPGGILGAFSIFTQLYLGSGCKDRYYIPATPSSSDPLNAIPAQGVREDEGQGTRCLYGSDGRRLRWSEHWIWLMR